MSTKDKSATTTDSSGNTATDSSGNTAKTTETTQENIFDQLFTKSNVIIIMWFIGFYIVVSLIMGLTSTNYSLPNNRIVIATRMLDFVVLIFTVITLIVTYFYKTESEKEKLVEDIYSGFTDSVDNPTTMVMVGVFLAVLYMLVMILGIPMDQNKPVTIRLLENFAWIYFSILVIALFFKFVLKISVRDFLTKMFDNTWNKKDETPVADKKSDSKEEVFNIATNIYTYDDAQAVCK
jgi:cytochrome bd-type quinol oxidase subunit 2